MHGTTPVGLSECHVSLLLLLAEHTHLGTVHRTSTADHVAHIFIHVDGIRIIRRLIMEEGVPEQAHERRVRPDTAIPPPINIHDSIRGAAPTERRLHVPSRQRAGDSLKTGYGQMEPRRMARRINGDSTAARGVVRGLAARPPSPGGAWHTTGLPIPASAVGGQPIDIHRLLGRALGKCLGQVDGAGGMPGCQCDDLGETKPWRGVAGRGSSGERPARPDSSTSGSSGA